MNPQIGGTSQVIRNTIPELEKLGIYSEVVCLNSPSEAFLSNDTFPEHALGAPKGPWQYNSKLIPWLIKNMSRFDALIVHGLWLFVSYAVWKATRKAKNPPVYFVMPHGMLDPYFQHAESRKLKAIRNLLYWKLIENKVVRDATGMLFTSETELLLAGQPFQPYYAKQEINIGYGIPNPPSFSAIMQASFLQKCPGLGIAPYILFLSRINYKKGVDLLIKGYAALLEEQADPNLIPNLVIAGPGLNSPYGRQMKQLVDESPLISSRVFFPGMLTGLAKWGAFYGCEAFILPSHQENFGIAVVEALACGKPVLISNQINIWETIEAEGGGLIAADSLDGTKHLLERWFNLSTEQKQLIAKQAKVTFLKYFHIEQSVRRMIEVLRTK